MTLLFTYLQLAVFIGYIGYVISKFGVLPSVSESWYRLNENRQGILFTLFCMALGVLMIYQSNETSPWFFFSAAGLCAVGVATAFNWKGAFTDVVHGAGAGIGIGCALIGLWVEYNNPMPFAAFLLISVLMKAFNIKNMIWWIEMAAFLVIIFGLFYRFM